MRVALLTANACAGDAIGSMVAEKLAFFLDQGADVRVLLESAEQLRPDVAEHGTVVDPAAPGEEIWTFLQSADLVIADFGHAYRLLGLLPALVGGKPRLVMDYHGVTPAALWGPSHAEAIEQAAGRRGLVWCADAAIAHSRFACQELIESTAFPAERCHRLSHLVDGERFAPGAPERDLRERLGLGAARIMLFVGRLAGNKRVPLLVEALDRLREMTPAVHLVVIGDDQDVYRLQAEKCRARAAELGLSERVHLRGRVSDRELRDAYRSADVFVSASRHEGFCLPVLEAMACAVPVVAARAGALPDTVGASGLLFEPDNVDDLARQLMRVLEPASGRPTRPGRAHLRVAIATERWEEDPIEDVDRTLRVIAEALQAAGHGIEVFTTWTGAQGGDNAPVPGTETLNGIAVHRFAVDSSGVEGDTELGWRGSEFDGAVSEQGEAEVITGAVRSRDLQGALRNCIDEFDAVITGPYASGVAVDVVREFAAKALLVGGFGDGPAVKLRHWQREYGAVGGLLYQTPEEEKVAREAAGIQTPVGMELGTYLDATVAGSAEVGRQIVGSDLPYVVFCGPYTEETALAVLLEYARRYSSERPGKLLFTFLGKGPIKIPDEAWARDLGKRPDHHRLHVLAGAAAFLDLSRSESLAGLCLEAWRQGVPVIGDRRSRVVRAHLRRCRGGRAVDSYETFARALDELTADGSLWKSMGEQGRDYVQARYGSRAEFTERVVQAIRLLGLPLAERMRRRGLARVTLFDRPHWRKRFGKIIEDVVHASPRACSEALEVEARASSRTAPAGEDTVVVPLRIRSAGTHALDAEGFGRTVLRTEVLGGDGDDRWITETSLPGLLVPGQQTALAAAVRVPPRPGVYQIVWKALKPGPGIALPEPCGAAMRLFVEAAPAADECEVERGLRHQATQSALVEAYRLQRLPDSYIEACDGRWGKWKRWLKAKILANFQRAYVDVLSRQQSAFNRRVLALLGELAESVARLESAAAADRITLARRMPKTLLDAYEKFAADGKGDDLLALVQHLTAELAENRTRAEALEGRLRRLEAPQTKEEA